MKTTNKYCPSISGKKTQMYMQTLRLDYLDQTNINYLWQLEQEI